METILTHGLISIMCTIFWGILALGFDKQGEEKQNIYTAMIILIVIIIIICLISIFKLK